MPDTHDAFSTFLSRLRTTLPYLRESAAVEAFDKAPQFNPFVAIGIQGKEDAFHTPVLAFLLDPAAAHGQRQLFLRHFFDMLKRYGVAPPESPLEVGEWKVETQVGIGRFGRLDIRIENAELQYVVVIENKIGIDDHDDQLGKYRRWMEAWRQNYHRHLFYLTRDGKRPVGADGGCRCLSYRVDVLDFLKAALNDVRAPSVHQFLSQYITLWEDDEESRMTAIDADICSFCLEAENVSHVLEVLSHGQHIRATLLREFWTELESYLKKTTPTELRTVLSGMEWSAESAPRAKTDWTGLYLSPTHFSDGQHLSYFIEHWSVGDRFYVAYGIGWELAADDSETRVAAVRKLCKCLKKLDFKTDDPREYLGYRTDFCKDKSAYSFLRQFIDNKESLLRLIAKQFWFLVSETGERLLQANTEVARRNGSFRGA